MFKNLFKAAAGVVALPVDLVADTITLGGSMTEQRAPYTFQRCQDVMKNLKKVTQADS